MKLRFRKNSLRLRVNRSEVQALASGSALEEFVHFPGNSVPLSYRLEPAGSLAADASFQDGVIRISVPVDQVRSWASSDDIGIYLEFPGDSSSLSVAIEKDLECVDGPEAERDPFAFPRSSEKSLC